MAAALSPSKQIEEWQVEYGRIWPFVLDLILWRLIHRQVRWMIRHNPKLPKHNVVYEWMAHGYVANAALVVRALVDDDPTTVSLWRFIDHIGRHPDVITRTWFLSQHDPAFRGSAQRFFNTFAPNNAKHVTAAAVRNDLKALESDTQAIVDFANEFVAHHARTPVAQATYKDLRRAIDVITRMTNRYAELLSKGGVRPPLVEPWKDVFRVAWMLQGRR